MTQLELFNAPPAKDFRESVLEFRELGTPTLVSSICGVPSYTNEFWTARQRQAGRIHEISYRACFKPQLPAFFIDRLTAPGDIVYDPFMGRGTTPVEAALRGRVPYGNDTNPLSVAFTEPRINPPTIEQVEMRLAEIPWGDFTAIKNSDLLAFYHPDTLSKIEGLRLWLTAREADGRLDKVDRWIRMVAINRLTGHSSGFFSVYTLPPNQAVSVARQLKINEKRNQVPPLRDVPAIILKKSRVLLSEPATVVPEGRLIIGQSDWTPRIESGSVALTVTSPPFLDIVDYESDNWLRCWFLGVDPKTVKISRHRTIEDWQEFIAGTLAELERVTRPGGHVAFEVGEVRNGKVQLENSVILAAENTRFSVLGVMINQQEFTKTSNCWGVSNNKSGTNSNRIVLLQKPS